MIPLFVTIDTEGDNGWARPEKITTENAKGIGRFQDLCEKYDIKPIYLTTYEMGTDDTFIKAVKKKNLCGKCEIGMHMHAWTTPPDFALTDNDFKNLPFITEYPSNIIGQKILSLTSELEKRFESSILSHRSGRWAVNDEYLGLLANNGYKIDCSYTPLIDWACSFGNPNGTGGPNYSSVPQTPFEIHTSNGSILEVPMTTLRNRKYDNVLVNSFLNLAPSACRNSKVYNALNGRKTIMLRPDIRKEKLQMSLISKLKNQKGIKHIELMIHSSEMYVGTCPHCNSEEDLNKLYDIMDKMFAELRTFSESMTFKEYLNKNDKSNNSVD